MGISRLWQVRSMPQNLIVKKQINGLPRETKEGIKNGFYYLGKDLVRTAQKLILKKPKTGRIYKIRQLKRTITHQASAPGEAPANLSGKLRKSIDFLVTGGVKMEFGALEGGTGQRGVKYARPLERGTRNAGVKHNVVIKPRPFLIRAIKLNYRNAQRHLDREINKALTKKV